MKFDTEGTYTLQYKAVDECGNETTEDREVIVANPRTVLYTDGTFIINESPKDMARNEQLHGAATNVYAPYDPNGTTSTERYEFASDTVRPWHNERSQIFSAIIGSKISPVTTSYWFRGFNMCESMDVNLLDTSHVTDMSFMFADLGKINALDLRSFDTRNTLNMSNMFQGCRELTSLDVSSFDTSNTTRMATMFGHCMAIKNLDLSSFDTGGVQNMNSMFMFCKALETIYASSQFVSDASRGNYMFGDMSSMLVGGAGTVWSSGHVNGDYAHIDGGTANPGYFTAKA